MILFHREIVDCQRSGCTFNGKEGNLAETRDHPHHHCRWQRSLFYSALKQLGCNKICNLKYLATLIWRNVGIRMIKRGSWANCFRTQNICKQTEIFCKNLSSQEDESWILNSIVKVHWILKPNLASPVLDWNLSFIFCINLNSKIKSHKSNPHHTSTQQSKFVLKHLSSSINAENHLAPVCLVTIVKYFLQSSNIVQSFNRRRSFYLCGLVLTVMPIYRSVNEKWLLFASKKSRHRTFDHESELWVHVSVLIFQFFTIESVKFCLRPDNQVELENLYNTALFVPESPALRLVWLNKNQCSH